MIKNWFITGDTHGKACIKARLNYLKEHCPDCEPYETALIILGDVGFNYYKNKTDWKTKHMAEEFGYTIYCLRGNHEERPSIMNYPLKWDADVLGEVYVEEEFPSIRYFKDEGEVYLIAGFLCLTVPGAYSVDKFYRLQNNWEWFPHEQLCESERQALQDKVCNRHFDIVLSHTCPFDWMPTDLFLPIIDQSTVDNSMEKWLMNLRDKITWGYWFFGHFHSDRVERPRVLQMSKAVYPLNGETLDMIEMPYYWVNKSPNFYMGV